MSIEKFKQTAADLFAKSAHNVLWANVENPNMEFFTSENLGCLSLKKDEKLTEFKREAIETPAGKKEKPADSKEVIAAILKVETLEGLKPYEADERKNVQAVYKNVLKKLTDQTPVVGATNVGATLDGNADTDTKK